MIVITSRDFAILLLYRCLRHSHTEHELRTIFHHLNFFKNDRKSQIAFLKIFLQTKNFFLTHFLHAKSTLNRDRELYKKRWCDRCELNRLILTEYWFIIELSQIIVAKRIDHCRETLYSIFSATRNWTNLSLIDDLMRSSTIICSMNT